MSRDAVVTHEPEPVWVSGLRAHRVDARRLVCTVIVAGAASIVSLWSSSGRRSFSNWDEARYVAMARTIAQDPDYYTYGSTYRPGYATLIAPLHWLTSDPEAVHRIALLLNALLGGVAAVFLIAMAARTKLPFGWCCVAALLAAVAPGVVLQTNWAAAETLMVVVVLAVILATMRLVDRPSFVAGVLVVLGSVVGYAIHGRLSPMVVSTSVVIVVLAASGRMDWLIAGALLVMAAFLTLAAHWYTNWAIDVTWTSSVERSEGAVLENLADPIDVAVMALGMTWYQQVTTIGVVGCGAWLVAHSVVRPDAPAGVGLRRPDALVVVAYVVPLAGIAAVFMSDKVQAAQQVYGRYWDGLAPPLVLYGVGVIGYGSRTAVRRAFATTFLVLIVSAVSIWLARQDHIDDAIRASGLGAGRRIMGLLVYLGSRAAIPILGITALAGALTLLIAAITFLRWTQPAVARVGVAFVLGSLAFVSISASRDHLIAGSEVNETAAAVRAVVDNEIVPSDAALEIDTRGAPIIGARWQAYQFYLPEREIRPYEPGRLAPAPHRYVFSRSNNEKFRALGGRRLWTDPHPRYPVALWEIPGDSVPASG
jgi:hypothetical protein